MLYQQSCTCTQLNSSGNGTANCNVGQDREALLFLGQNAFNVNFVMKIISSLSHVTRNTD